MKKLYIKPEDTVVIIQTERIIAESLGKGDGKNGFDAAGREVVRQDIKSQDAWEEW